MILLPKQNNAVYYLKDNVTERDIKKVARGLILLSDPFDDDPNAFKPILKAAGFEVKQRLKGMHVSGYNCTQDGVTYICAHTGTGLYPAERIAAVIARTAPIAGE